MSGTTTGTGELARSAALLVLLCVVLIAICRSPEFTFLAPFFVEKGVHNGYVGAYGHFLILLLGVKFFSDLADCLTIRSFPLTCPR